MVSVVMYYINVCFTKPLTNVKSFLEIISVIVINGHWYDDYRTSSTYRNSICWLHTAYAQYFSTFKGKITMFDKRHVNVWIREIMRKFKAVIFWCICHQTNRGREYEKSVLGIKHTHISQYGFIGESRWKDKWSTKA